MTRKLFCHAEGREGRWEAYCVDLDIAVTGSSFEDVRATLQDAISTYVEDALNEEPSQARRLLARRAPWHVTAHLVLKFLWHSLWRRSGHDREDARFTLTSPA